MKPILVAALMLTAVSCQKSRADYRDDIAGAVCAQMQGCDKIGEGKRFANLDDCRTQLAARYNKQWSAKKCEQKIDPAKFASCRSRAVTNACGGNFLDDISFSIECGANDVCVAPAEPGK